MFTNDQIAQLQKLLKQQKKEIGEDNNRVITASVENLKKYIAKEVNDSEKRLENKISESQEDTITVLSDVINTGYGMHEKRIQRVEDELDLSPLKQ